MDLMIDLETMATEQGNAAIAQIGWAAFDPDSTGVQATGLIHVDVQSCLDLGMAIDWETVQWWLRQDEAARMSLQTGREARHLFQALRLLQRAYIQHSSKDPNAVGSNDPREIYTGRVWAYPADFDLSILRHAYSLHRRFETPWFRRRTRDAKTLVLAAGVTRDEIDAQVDDLGLGKHRADHDCIRQVYYVQAAVRALGGIDA